jgi:7-cyano-7-deazaguanine synthase in queuosine biosynthesis
MKVLIFSKYNGTKIFLGVVTTDNAQYPPTHSGVFKEYQEIGKASTTSEYVLQDPETSKLYKIDIFNNHLKKI